MNNLNFKDMRLINLKSVLDSVRDFGYSRAELSRVTGLTRAGITILVSELIRQGLVEEGDIGATEKRGRKPSELRIRGDAHLVAGINLSRDGVNIGVTDFACHPIEGAAYALQSRAKTLETIESAIDGYLRKFGKERFIGIGAVTPGPVNANTGQILTPPNFEQWHRFNIKQHLEERFGLPVCLENNSSAVTLFENNYGLGKQLNNFIGLVVDSGIGSGVIINGKLYGGTSGLGAELGHCSIDRNGPLCACGRKGCAELYASLKSIINHAKEIDVTLSSWRIVADRAESGDAAALSVIAREADCLAELIANASNSFDIPDFVVIGELAENHGILQAVLEKKVNSIAIGRSTNLLRVFFVTGCKWNSYLSAANLVLRAYQPI